MKPQDILSIPQSICESWIKNLRKAKRRGTKHIASLEKHARLKGGNREVALQKAEKE